MNEVDISCIIIIHWEALNELFGGNFLPLADWLNDSKYVPKSSSVMLVRFKKNPSVSPKYPCSICSWLTNVLSCLKLQYDQNTKNFDESFSINLLRLFDQQSCLLHKWNLNLVEKWELWKIRGQISFRASAGKAGRQEESWS